LPMLKATSKTGIIFMENPPCDDMTGLSNVLRSQKIDVELKSFMAQEPP